MALEVLHEDMHGRWPLLWKTTQLDPLQLSRQNFTFLASLVAGPGLESPVEGHHEKSTEF